MLFSRLLARQRRVAWGLGLWLLALSATAAETVRVGVLAFGTVNWELQAMQNAGLDAANGVDLQVVPLASGDASTVALQGGAVDVIVSDWLWVARQRATGKPYSFYPYSKAVGGIMVPADSPVRQLADLRGKRLGIAGGPHDKSWLLLRAYAQQSLGENLAQMVTPQFAAPPLLNRLLEQGDLDAVLNYWHFGARLAAQGMREVIDTPTAVRALGVGQELPLIGWVFNSDWAQRRPEAIAGFLSASYQTKALLARSDEAWGALRTAMKAPKDSVFHALRTAYRAGIPHCLGDEQRQAAEQAFGLFVAHGGATMTGGLRELDDGVFWSGPRPQGCRPL
jgi:NitT/TauT family transport system substrate-binding protein